jgi:hypothetical protein
MATKVTAKARREAEQVLEYIELRRAELLEQLNALAEVEQDQQALLARARGEERGYADLGIVEATWRLFDELQVGALGTAEIARELKARNVKSNATYFLQTVYAMLRESPRFQKRTVDKKWVRNPEYLK